MRISQLIWLSATTADCLVVSSPRAPKSHLPTHHYVADTAPFGFLVPSQEDHAPDSRRRRGTQNTNTTSTVITSPPLIWYSDLVASADDHSVLRVEPSGGFEDITRIALKTVHRTAWLAATGTGIWGIYTSCRDYSNGEGNAVEVGPQCIIASITTPILLVSNANAVKEWVGSFAQDIKWVIVDKAINYITPSLGGMLASLGPYLSPGRREVTQRTEEKLSTYLGAQVRHIGFWDDVISGHVTKRQEQNTPTPVFAMSRDGYEVHFTVSQDQDTGRVHIRTGHGPGPETQANSRRLRARAQVPKFNKQFFDSGGFDLVGHSDVMGNSNEDDAQPDPANPTAYAHVYKAVACYLGVAEGATSPPSDDVPGLWWQIYDRESKGTLAAGAIAPFTAETPSIIEFLQPEGGLNVKSECSPVHDEL